MKRPYIGQFDAAKVNAVLKAAEPIPTSRIRWKDPATENIHTVSRSEAVIRHLDWISTSAALSKNELPPSDLAKKLHAITGAAEQLAKLLRNLDDLPQIQHALWAVATDNGEGDPDYRLQEILEGVAQLTQWCKSAGGIARGRVGRVPPKLDEPADVLMAAGMEQEPLSQMNEVLVGTHKIWTEILKRQVRTSYSPLSGEGGGPLIRFQLACLDALGMPNCLTSNALRQRNRALLRKGSRFQKT